MLFLRQIAAIDLRQAGETTCTRVFGTQAETVRREREKGGLRGIVALLLLQTVTGKEGPSVLMKGGLQQVIPSMGRLRHTVSRPGIIGKVCIGHELQMGRGFPGETEIEATLVLRTSSRTVALGIERRIAEGIEPLQSQQTPGVAKHQTGTVDGSQMPCLINSRLTIE